MYQGKRILAVIPARGGSKAVPRKNIKPVLGKPLIAYSIEVGLQSELLDKLIVSSDDEEIIEISKKYGAEVPFVRPKDLGLDTIPMVPVLKHAVEFMESLDKTRYDYIILLQPTDPLRIVEDVDNVIKKLVDTDADSVISLCQVDSVHPILMKKIENDKILPYCIEEKEGTRRQDYKPDAYMRNGAIYAVSRDVLMEKGSIWGEVSRPYIMPKERSVGIDDELDFKLVEILLTKREEKAKE
jgi:CMP-N-acetylneuraminic acid synthetase